MNEQARTISDRTTAVDGASPGVNAALLIVLGTLVLTALLYWQTSIEIVDFWQDTARRRYTHGWAVLAVTIWLIWRDRQALRAIPLAPPLGGWVVVALGSLAWLVATNAGLLVPTMLVLPMLVLAAVWAAGGPRLALHVAFPVLYLYFALPIWDAIDLPLQWLTTVVSLWAVGLVGIPATTDGFVIHIPAGWFEIASSCNGLHFFIVALAIAAVHGQIDRARWPVRLLLLAFAGGLALFTNWLRVFIVIVAGHLTDMQHFLIQVDHYYFGWVLFAFALVAYIFLAPRGARSDGRARDATSPPPAKRRGPGLSAVVLTAAALAAGPVWSLVNGGSQLVKVLPPVVDGWQGPSGITSDWHPVFAQADEEWQVEYRSEASGVVALYVAAYGRQHQGKELRGHGNSVTGTDRVLHAVAREWRSGGTAVPVTEWQTISAAGHRRLVWSFFAIDGRPSRVGLRDQLEYGLHALGHAPTAAVIALASECQLDCEDARATLETLPHSFLPELLALLEPRATP